MLPEDWRDLGLMALVTLLVIGVPLLLSYVFLGPDATLALAEGIAEGLSE
jgi:hypothetical protein